MTCAPRKQSKTYKVPKRPYEAARLDAELKVGFDYFNEGWRFCRVGWIYIWTVDVWTRGLAVIIG